MENNKLYQAVKDAMEGKKDAFARLCRLKGRDILYVSIRLMGNTGDAEDVTQDILVHIYHHIGELKDPGAFQVWLYQIIRGKCVSMIRKNKSLTETYSKSFKNMNIRLSEMEFIPAQIIMDETKRKVLMEIIDALSVRCKLCLLMFYYERMSYEEIARSMEIDKKAVENALTRARQLIVRDLEMNAVNRSMLEKAEGIAPAALFTSLFMEDIVHEVPMSVIEDIISGCIEIIGDTPPLFLSSRDYQTANPSAASAGKVVMGIVITAGVVAIGAVLYDSKQPVQPVPEPLLADPVLMQAEEERAEEEEIIITLEDMIGDADAASLRELHEQDALRKDEVEEFLRKLGMTMEESIWNPVSAKEHTLYLKDRQDKRLMVIVRYEVEEDICTLAYRFTVTSEVQPADVELRLNYEEWI